MKPYTLLFLLFFGISFGIVNASDIAVEKTYTKEYYDNGKVKAEGWQLSNSKTDYWYFYHPNGKVASKGSFKNNRREGYWYFYRENGGLEKEGHYVADSAENWWIFYDIANHKTNKFQYKNNQKNGFSLRYSKRKLVKAEKYSNGTKEGEWTSVWAFRKDNPGVSLK